MNRSRSLLRARVSAMLAITGAAVLLSAQAQTSAADSSLLNTNLSFSARASCGSSAWKCCIRPISRRYAVRSAAGEADPVRARADLDRIQQEMQALVAGLREVAAKEGRLVG